MNKEWKKNRKWMNKEIEGKWIKKERNRKNMNKKKKETQGKMNE